MRQLFLIFLYVSRSHRLDAGGALENLPRLGVLAIHAVPAFLSIAIRSEGDSTESTLAKVPG